MNSQSDPDWFVYSGPMRPTKLASYKGQFAPHGPFSVRDALWSERRTPPLGSAISRPSSSLSYLAPGWTPAKLPQFAVGVTQAKGCLAGVHPGAK